MPFFEGPDIKDTAIPALNIDWKTQSVFYKDISVNSTFTFSNLVSGKTIVVSLKNTSGSNITVAFPTLIQSSINLTIAAGKTNVYTFVRVNGGTLASVIDGMA